MMKTTRWAMALTLSLVLIGAGLAQQPQPQQQPARPVYTTITIPKMDCGGCAKKIATQLSAVPGVGQVNQNLDAFQLIVAPQPNVGVSPRLLWEAVEKAGYAPSKIESPYGNFAAKPQI